MYKAIHMADYYNTIKYIWQYLILALPVPVLDCHEKP